MKIKTTKGIKLYYKEQAKKFGTDKRSTISDINTRNLEIEALLKYIENNKDVLEIGCGNGYTAKVIAEKKKINLTAIDFSEDLIKLAKKQIIKGSISKVTFNIGDATNLKFPDNSFDVVFTERCLINLITWNHQKKALSEIFRVLKSRGVLILLEAFSDGWENLNKTRAEFGLKAIPQSPHNTFFEKEKVINFFTNKLEFLKEDNFLSTYHFGSRVLYPILLKATTNKEPEYNSPFSAFFAKMMPYGNYSSVGIMIFKKI